MARKAAITPEQIGRVGQRKSKRVIDPDDVLTPQESALIAKARREMREGKYISLTQLEHDLGLGNGQIGS